MAKNKERKVSKELRSQARELGLCDEWYSAWSDDSTFDELIDKFITGYDFCVEKDWPDPKYVIENFPLECLRANGVFCDDVFTVSDKRNVVVFGDSSVNLYYSDFSFGDVRVRHTSSVTAKIDALAVVHIHAYDNAYVNVEAENGAKVTLFVHSKDVKYVLSGSVKIKEDYGEKETSV